MALLAIYIVSKIDEKRGIICTPNYSEDNVVKQAN